jgi:hypothetical protein
VFLLLRPPVRERPVTWTVQGGCDSGDGLGVHVVRKEDHVHSAGGLRPSGTLMKTRMALTLDGETAPHLSADLSADP